MITISVIIGVIVAYLIGSAATSVWIGRLFYNVDVRTKGSGNAGATNTLRVLGTKPGIVVLVLDGFKGWLAVYLGYFFAPEFYSEIQLNNYFLILALAAVIGHIFPIWVGFKGGKGVATIVGVIIALFPTMLFLISLGIFIFVLILSGYVSLSSISTAIAIPLIVIFILHRQHDALIIFAIMIGVFIPFTHKKNIVRLFNGTENKFRFSRKKE